MTPYFSIIIPTYNRANIVLRAIKAALEQSFEDAEVIVVDDGSTDNTSEIVHSLNHPRLKYIYQQNKGVCAARNFGASVSNGKYLLFYDSDDLLMQTALMDFKNANVEGNADLLFGDVEKKSKHSNKTVVITSSNPYGNNLGKGLYLAGSFCISKIYFDKIGGYDEQIRFGENTELRFRIDLQKPVKAFANSIVLFYEVSPNGGSSNSLNKIRSNEYIMHKHGYYFKQYPKVLQMYFQNNAISYFQMKQYRMAFRNMIHAGIAHPRKIKIWIRLILMCFPPIYNQLLNKKK